MNLQFGTGKTGYVDYPEGEARSCAPVTGSAAERVAAKWKCSLQEAEHKIEATMGILALDRENAVSFLDEVRLEIGRQPNQPPNTVLDHPCKKP